MTTRWSARRRSTPASTSGSSTATRRALRGKNLPTVIRRREAAMPARTEAPARHDTADSTRRKVGRGAAAVTDYLGTHARAMLTGEDAVRAGADEGVHDMRVATRR